MNKMNIIFMGTPEFAVPCLNALIKTKMFNIKAVYTQPDKPVGRKQILTAPPVKQLALEHDIPVLQPNKIRKNNEVLEHLKSLDLDLIIVVAYGKILPQEILDIPKFGCINVHASLLEKYRGAAPIQWAIANGETETGVTSMLMDAGMDTGYILLKKSCKINLDDTTITLSKRLSDLGADLLIETIPQLINKTISPIKQDDSKATKAPIINKNDGQIKWYNSASEIYNLLRAFTPWPSVFTIFSDTTLKITQCNVILEKPERNYEVGQVVEINKSGIVVATGSGLLLITKLQLSGSKEMNATDFARGQRLEPGYIFADTMLC